MELNLKAMTTETRNPATMELDKMSALEIVTVMNREDEKIPAAIRAVLPQIARCAEIAGETVRRGGRIIYMGAGTSGRLGVLDAVECPPTFGVPYGTVVGLVAIAVFPGPECVTGSTRLKAGTCQKLILNMISTAAMVSCGTVYQNLMVDVEPSNAKLVVRARNIVMEATGCDAATAEKTIALAGSHAKTAITMILADCSVEEARARLERAQGHVRLAIQ